MNITEFAAAYAERSDRLRAPVAVPIDGVGTVYVRQIMVDEQDYVSEIMKTADDSGENEAVIMAFLMCHETGERLSEAERNIVLPAFRKATRQDYNAMWAAATRGPKTSEPPGN